MGRVVTTSVSSVIKKHSRLIWLITISRES